MPRQYCPVCGGAEPADACGCSLDVTDADPALARPYVPQVPFDAEASGRPAPARDLLVATLPPPPAAHASVNAPMCPVDGEQTTWVNLTDPGDDTWSCPACGRFGWVLPVEYHERHPQENLVQVTGILPRKPRQDVAAPAAQVPVAQTPMSQTDPGDGAGAAEDVPADAEPGPAGGLVAFLDSPDKHGEPPGRAARRAKQHGRRGLRLLAAGAGILALGIGLAFASGPRGDHRHAALPPVPSTTPDAVPSDSQATPTTAAPASPTPSPDPTPVTPTTAAPASPTATPSGKSPDLTRMVLPVKQPALPIKQPANTALPAPPAPLPTPSPTARILKMGNQDDQGDQGDQGPKGSNMQ